MASQSHKNPRNLYPEVIQSNPESALPFSSSSSTTTSTSFSPSAPSLYPSLDMKDLDENLFVDTDQSYDPRLLSSFESSEEVVIRIPGSIIHLIDKQQSIELASGVLEIVRLRQGNSIVAVLARVGNVIQWPLAKDEAAVKLDGSHYFFTLRVPSETNSGSDSDFESENLLNYGLTVTGKGLGKVLKEFDRVLEEYSAFSVKELERSVAVAVGVEDGGSAEAKAAAYWTTLAPNVEDYSGSVARMIAAGSGQLIKGILWCGDVTVDRLKWGNEFLKKRTKSGSKSDVSPEALKRMKRAKRLTKMSEGVATGILSGVVKVSGLVTSSIVNSKPGKKFFNLLPGEIILASLDGFNKVCDALEVAGRNVMSTTSTVTTDFVSHRHGEDAAKVTNEGLGAAGHAIGTAWAVFKIRKAINPKSVIKPTTLVKAAASQSKSSKSKT